MKGMFEGVRDGRVDRMHVYITRQRLQTGTCRKATIKKLAIRCSGGTGQQLTNPCDVGIGLRTLLNEPDLVLVRVPVDTTTRSAIAHATRWKDSAILLPSIPHSQEDAMKEREGGRR